MPHSEIKVIITNFQKNTQSAVVNHQFISPGRMSVESQSVPSYYVNNVKEVLPTVPYNLIFKAHTVCFILRYRYPK